MKRSICCVSLIFILIGISWTQTLPPGLPVINGASVNAIVTFDSNTGIFKYSYTVQNSSASVGKLDSFSMDITTTSGGVPLGSEGLINSATGYLSIISASNINELGVSIIPVGLESQPIGWEGAISLNGRASWNSGLSPAIEVGPSQSLNGFVLTSHGLPGIRKFNVGTFFNPRDFFPIGTDEAASEQEAEKIVQQFNMASEATVFKATTIGPISPPSLTNPLQLTDFLVSLKHQSASLGWISGPGSDGLVISLDAKLSAAKAAIGRGQNGAAKNQLNAFINELDAQRGKSINDNAYFLLKTNAQFIISKLDSP